MGTKQKPAQTSDPGILASLRALVPREPLRYSQTLQIAEQQADLVLRRAEIMDPPVPTDAIAQLPRLHVIYDDSPVAGSAHWDGRDWIIVIDQRQREPKRRQTLAHEFKHVVDHTTRGFLYTGMARLSATEQSERAADYFAGCLLMPRSQVESALTRGCRTADDYAGRFAVTAGFATRRLHQLGLAPGHSRQLSLLQAADPLPAPELDTPLGADT